MAKPAESDWMKFARAQPSVSAEERAPGAAAKAESFIIELADENLLLKIKRDDGRVALVELTPETAFYLREYLTNALATIGMPD
ncbi:MAG: hypothetical protein NXI18_05690 [Alphaproteobacteria bacterium]|nr:hypothetical protein [Alphaproteobacteria bacterium]